MGRIGYYLPFGVASGVLTIIGSGPLTTLTPTSPTGNWVGYQILQGVGPGFGVQIPLLAVQNNSTKEEVSILTALVVFSQQFGGAVFLSLAQVVFGKGLRDNLAIYAPDANAEGVIAAGATAVRSAVSAASFPGVLLAYSKAFDHVMYLATGAAGGALFFAFGMGWSKLRGKRLLKPRPRRRCNTVGRDRANFTLSHKPAALTHYLLSNGLCKPSTALAAARYSLLLPTMSIPHKPQVSCI